MKSGDKDKDINMDFTRTDAMQYSILPEGRRISMYGDHDCTILLGVFHEGLARYPGTEIKFECSVLQLNEIDLFEKIIRTTASKYLHVNAFLKIYGFFPDRLEIVTERVQDSLDSYLFDKECYNGNFATKASRDIIRSILKCAQEINANKIYLGTITASTILIVGGGKPKFVVAEGPDESGEDESGDVDSFRKMFMTALPEQSIAKESCAFVEKESFCKYFNYSVYAYHHPFLMTHEERARMSLYLVTRYGHTEDLYGLYTLVHDWSSCIDHKSVCGIVLDYSKRKRADNLHDYGKTLVSLAYFLRDFEEHWNSEKSKNAYQAENGDTMPHLSLEERNDLLVKKLGPKYLINLYDYCRDNNLKYW